MSICFYLAMATQTLGALCRKKVLSELPNGSMIKNGLSHPGTQGDQLANEEKPAPTFSIGELEKVLDTMLAWGKALLSLLFSQRSILHLFFTSLNVELRRST